MKPEPKFEANRNYFVVIKPDADTLYVEEIERPPELEKLRAGVVGDIEVVPFFDKLMGRKCVAFCNEHGKLERMPINHAANVLWRLAHDGMMNDVLVGPIVVILGSPSFLAKL